MAYCLCCFTVFEQGIPHGKAEPGSLLRRGMEVLVMEISTFKVKVQKAVREVLGQEYTVELREVQKNNGVLLQGLTIRKGQDNVTPTIYLNAFWEAYEGGVTFAEIIKKIISIYREDGIGRKIDVSFFRDFEKVKEKICFRLVNREKNRELLEKVPYIPLLDLAVCFYYAFDGGGVENGMIPIYRSHLDAWKVTDRELLECAMKNTPALFPYEIIPMQNALEDMIRELPEEMREEILCKISMVILTNSRKTYGACSILYPGVLERMAKRMGGDFYMIPSSVHEFLLMPREQERGDEELKEMIAEVNRTEVSAEEVLSDHLYLYCCLEGKVRIV